MDSRKNQIRKQQVGLLNSIKKSFQMIEHTNNKVLFVNPILLHMDEQHSSVSSFYNIQTNNTALLVHPITYGQTTELNSSSYNMDN